ncbi:hypothetical protein HY009_05910 [Candidatus Acetothermia bacterium]|nr:hypothetical protein [Candidatus Acetothermia bacterium]
MRGAYLWIGLAVVALVVSGLGISAKAEPKPSDYWSQEFFFAELGAVGGGIMGFVVCAASGSSDNCKYMYSLLTGESDVCGGGLCNSFLVGISLGRALGASTGVVLTGWILGVEGNILAAYLATGLWFISPGLLPFLPVEWREIFWAPLVPAIVATISYNIGAKMKSDKSKPVGLSWHLPLVALRF